MRLHGGVHCLDVDFTGILNNGQSQVSGPMADNSCLGLIDEILDLIDLVFVASDELLFLPSFLLG